MIEHDPRTVDLGDYLGVLRRHRVLIAVFTLLAVGMAAAYVALAPRTYASTSKVLVKPVTADPFASPGPIDQVISIETEREIVTSEAVAGPAAELLSGETTARDILEGTSVVSPPDTQILEITVTGATAEEARDRAQALADSYIKFKTSQALESAAALQASSEQELQRLDGELQGAEERLDQAAAGSATARQATAQRDIIRGQIAILRNRLSSLGVASPDPGDVIAPAELPTSPASPNATLDLMVALFLGGIAGVLVAFARDRSDDGIRDPAEVEAIIGAPILAAIPHSHGRRARRQGLATLERSGGAAAEAFRAVAARLLHGGGPKRLMVVGAMEAGETAIAAANIGVALTQTGQRIGLVDTDFHAPSMHALFGVGNDRGLSTALDNGDPSASATRIEAVERLLVMPTGRAPAEPASALHPARVQRVLDELLGLVDIAILLVAPVAASADAVTLATHVDGVVVIADGRHVTKSALARTRREIAGVGGRLLGLIVVNGDAAWDASGR